MLAFIAYDSSGASGLGVVSFATEEVVLRENSLVFNEQSMSAWFIWSYLVVAELELLLRRCVRQGIACYVGKILGLHFG